MAKRSMKMFVLFLALSMLAVACASSQEPGSDEGSSGAEAQRGGTLVWETEEFGFTGGFDPVGEYLGEAHGIYTNLLLRNLVSYKHTADAAGNELVPDLAVEIPEPTQGGTEYTFTIKDGVRFGPPVSREIVCADFEYAFRRIATEDLIAQYPYYYEGVIEGLEVGEDPGAGGIPGITCNGDKEITFTLEEPTGDFLYRLGMPATAPAPKEVAGCMKRAGEYGRYVVSSSSYMLEGSDELDASSCESLEPISGYDPRTSMVLVRNPEYDQSTDDYRENWFDRFERNLNSNTSDIEKRLETGDNDVVLAPTPQTLRGYVLDNDLKERLHVHSGDRTWYITMTLNEVPFDDIHVRKAVNLVMDKAGLQRAWGGPTQGDIATHIIPDTLLNNVLDDYDPYPSEDYSGDVEAAKEEMSQSKYDSDGDGICDAPECDGVLHVTSNTPPYTDMLPVIESSLEKIGITLESREVTDAYTPIQTAARRVPISSRPGWGKDYPDVYTFAVLFGSENIACEGNFNYSLVGLKEETARRCDIPFAEVPSVDDKIDECYATTDSDDRLACWADLDRQLMEDVVPWVPYLDAKTVYATSADITKWDYDQFPGTPAWSKIAVDPAS